MDSRFPDNSGSPTGTEKNVAGRLSSRVDLAEPSLSAHAGTQGSPSRHKGHNHWMHVLMCAPMLLVVGYLVLADKAGGATILYALGCVVMMGVMMAMMNRGRGNDTSGHRH